MADLVYAARNGTCVAVTCVKCNCQKCCGSRVQSQLHAVVRLLYSWRFAYVENLTWVHMGPNNRPLAEAAPHARCSHSTLLMFRKEGEQHRCKFTLLAKAATAVQAGCNHS